MGNSIKPERTPSSVVDFTSPDKMTNQLPNLSDRSKSKTANKLRMRYPSLLRSKDIREQDYIELKVSLPICQKGSRKNPPLPLNIRNMGNGKEMTKLPKSLMNDVTKRIPNLENLDLLFFDVTTDKMVETITTFSSRHFSDLKALHLRFCEAAEISDKSLNILGREISHHLVNLKSIDLFFSGSQAITDEGVEKLISQILRHLTKLESISLTFTKCDKLTGKCLKGFKAGNGRHLVNLKKLHLNLNFCPKVCDDGLETLNFLKYLKNLEQLSLFFHTSDNITNKTIENVIPLICRNLVKVNNLELRFAYCPINNDGFKALEQVPKHLVNLENIYLDFFGTQITCEARDDLVDIITQQKLKLNKFNLFFDEFKKADTHQFIPQIDFICT